MKANKARAILSGPYFLEQVNAVWVFGVDLFLQMEIIHHMVCLKTLISAELFITANDA